MSVLFYYSNSINIAGENKVPKKRTHEMSEIQAKDA